ncbi:MAG TPA: hypothetical protein PLI77_01000 [Bacteroidales bacterium]|nr:hypothetical protein [Bacteroidales bacterium]
MKSIIEHQTKKLDINKPDFSRKEYQIIFQDDVYGTLIEDDIKETLSTITTHNASYSVKRSGFFNPYITLRKGKFEINEAICYLDLRKETSITLDDQVFYFKIHNFWKNQWCWTNEKHQVIITFKPIVSGTIKGEIEISKEAFHYTQLELLSLLGVYFMIKYQNEIQN